MRVKRLKGWKAGATRLFVSQNGNIRAESKLSPGEVKQFRQKLVNLLVPLAHEEIVGGSKEEI